MELRAEDLKINNWVNFLGKPKQVLGISKRNYNMGTETAGYYIEFKEHMPVNFIHIKPIPLDEEWLLKLGFKKLENNLYSYDEFISCKAEDNDWDDLCLDLYVKDWESNKMVYASCCTHVHQLQNLIKSLTGKELVIGD